MKTITLLLPFCIVAAVAAYAQDPAKKPDPAAKPAAQEKPKAERPKDDELTAKDPAIVAIDKFIESKVPAKRPDNWRSTLTVPPKVTFTKDVQYEWRMKTNKGDVTVRLMPDVAPMHVSSTIYLARLGFYDSLKFHRVIPEFMAQGGDPTGTGRGGPGYNYDSELDPKVKHDKPGKLSMANTGQPNSDGSQFFLTFVPTPFLDGKHTVFGDVTAGMDTLKALEAAGSPGSGATKEPLFIEQSWIVVVPAPKPAAAPEEPKKKEGQ